MRTRIIREHETIPGDNYHEMVWLGDTLRLDSLGRHHRNARRRWAKVICNNPECHGLVLVNEAVIFAAASEARA